MLNLVLFLILYGSGVANAAPPETVEFVSGQSYSSKGDHIINQVSFSEEGTSDLWTMRQRKEHDTAWTLLTIQVDKSANPKKARFTQWKNDGGKNIPGLF